MNKKIEKILNWSLAIVLISGVFWFQCSISEEYRDTAENGIDTVGIVVSRSRTGSVKPEKAARLKSLSISISKRV